MPWKSPGPTNLETLLYSPSLSPISPSPLRSHAACARLHGPKARIAAAAACPQPAGGASLEAFGPLCLMSWH